LYIFCGEHLLCARLRTADHGEAHGALEELVRIITQIRAAWPHVRILVRGDSGFCRDEIMAWCEGHDVDYLFGLAKNSRLLERIEQPLARIVYRVFVDPEKGLREGCAYAFLFHHAPAIAVLALLPTA
jgi:hypothetical protein